MLLSEHSKEPNMILLSLKKGLYVFFKFKEKTGASYTPPFFCLFTLCFLIFQFPIHDVLHSGELFRDISL